MKIIKIKKSGKLLVEEVIGETITTEKVKTMGQYLGCDVEFEEGLTFGTFFKLILKEKGLFDTVFCQELNGKKLKDFEQQLNDEPEKFEDDFKLSFLEVSKIFELFTFEKGVSTIDLFPVFIGLGKTTDNFDVFIPLSFFSVAELKDLEIVQNKLVEVYKDASFSGDKEDDEDEEEEESTEDEQNEEIVNDEGMVAYFEAVSRVTIYETIQCIIYEMAYYKNNEDRMQVRKSQSNEHNSKNKIMILNNQLKQYIENEEYEKAAVTKREIDRLIISSKKAASL